MQGSREAAGVARADLVVIGAGIIGCAVAAAAADEGLDTIVVDRLGGPGFGSTSASAGIVRVHATDPASCAIAEESLYSWQDWRAAAEVPSGELAAEFVRSGTLILDADSEFAQAVRATMTAVGVEHQIVDTDDLRAGWPDLDLSRHGGPREPDDERFWADPTEEIDSGVHTPASGYVADCLLATRNLADLARSRGVRWCLGHEVVEVMRHRDRVRGVRLADGGRVEGPAVVNAAGPASGVVNGLAGVGADATVRTRPVRQELHHLPLPDGLALGQRAAHVVDGDLGTNFRTEGAALLVGSQDAAIDPADVLADPDDFDPRPTLSRWERSTLRLARRIPALTIPRRPSGVAGVYDVSDDWLPIYDRTELDGFYLAMGSSGHQFKAAPVIGPMMAALVRRGLEGTDQDVSPLQHRLPHSGRVVDTGVFSRRRAPGRKGQRG